MSKQKKVTIKNIWFVMREREREREKTQYCFFLLLQCKNVCALQIIRGGFNREKKCYKGERERKKKEFELKTKIMTMISVSGGGGGGWGGGERYLKKYIMFLNNFRLNKFFFRKMKKIVR